MIKCGWRCIAIGCLCIIVGIGIWFWICGSHTTVLLVRHGDRDSSVDDLNDLGDARALELAHVVDKAGLDAIIRSDTVRTTQTAEPTATAEGLTPIELPENDIAAFVAEIRNNHRGQRVLVVAHSHTLPDIITGLGGPAVTIGGNEYDNFYVLTICRCRWGSARLVNLQYGASTQ